MSEKPSLPDTKPAMRTEFLARREELSAEEISRLGSQLLDRALKQPEISNAHTLAAYISMGSELPTMPLLSHLLQQGTKILVPRLGKGRDIGWSYFGSARELSEVGKHRPAEPQRAEVLGLEALKAADTILVPAFFIDREGYRLGRGAGWYDQALLHARPSATLIGVAYPWETSEKRLLPRNTHDIAVDVILTPEQTVRLRS
jgi:5-formyltetrahydrofolate cyclo-ligase